MSKKEIALLLKEFKRIAIERIKEIQESEHKRNTDISTIKMHKQILEILKNV
jgi:hypothetical protein